MDTPKRIIRRRPAAERLGVSERTLDRITGDPKSGLHKVKVSKRLVGVAEDELDDYEARAVAVAKTA